jgi:hypothetical protein
VKQTKPYERPRFGVFLFSQHPNYDNVRILNDIALIIISEVVSLSYYVKLACLPDATSNSFPNATTEAWTSGWGYTSSASQNLPNVLYNIKLPIVDSSQCSVNYDYFDATSQICAGK